MFFQLSHITRLVRFLKKNKNAAVVCCFLFLFVVGAFAIAHMAAERARKASFTPDTARVTPASGAFEKFDGTPYSFADSHADFVVVTSFASWCPQCVEHLTALARLKATSDRSIEIIAINRKEDKNIARSYVKELSLPESITYVFDPDDVFFTRIGGFAMPETVIYDSDGMIVAHERQPLTFESLQTIVTSLPR